MRFIIKTTRNKWWNKRKLNMLDDKKNNIWENLYTDLTTLITTCEFCEKPFDFECIEKERNVLGKQE